MAYDHYDDSITGATVSDSAVAILVSGLITVTTMVVGFLTLWVKLKYSAERAEEAAIKAEEAVVKAEVVEGKIDRNTIATRDVESKIDCNTLITERIEKQTNGVLDARIAELANHARRITSVETSIEGMKVGLQALLNALDSRRHEMRGQLQTIINNLQLLSVSPRTTDQVAKGS